MLHDTFYTPLMGVFSARVRRFSRTAVGFPIRNDLCAYSQGVCGGSPSWVFARRAYAYVRGLLFSVVRTMNQFALCLLSTAHLLSCTARRPWLVLLSSLCAAVFLLLTSLHAPHLLLTSLLPTPRIDLIALLLTLTGLFGVRLGFTWVSLARLACCYLVRWVYSWGTILV